MVSLTIAGNMSQSSHQSGAWVNLRAVNRAKMAITARQKVAIFTPSIRGTWLADKSVPSGGPSIMLDASDVSSTAVRASNEER